MESTSSTYHEENEAKAVSKILARSDPADMPSMRASLSFLTSAGADLATALQKRNQDYDNLVQIVSALPPEWVQAARSGETFPDLGALRAELVLAKDQRTDLQEQLAERQTQLATMEEQLAQLQAELESRPAADYSAEAAAEAQAISERIAALQVDLELAELDRAETEGALQERDAELADLEGELTGLVDEITAALPAQPQEDVVEAEEGVEAETVVNDLPEQDDRKRRAVRLGALATAISAIIQQNQEAGVSLQQAADQLDELQSGLDLVTSDKIALELDLEEKIQGLGDVQTQVEELQTERESLTAQIETLTGQATELQSQLDTAAANLTEAQEQLTARENELAELNQQVETIGLQVRSALPEDLIAQLESGDSADQDSPDQASADEEGTGEEGADQEAPDQEASATAEESGQTRSVAKSLVGVAALGAGVSALTNASSQQGAELDQLNAQVESLTQENADLQATVQENELAVADLNSQIEALNAQIADLQAQLDEQTAAQAELQAQLDEQTAAQAELQQQLDESQATVADLNNQIETARSTLMEMVPLEEVQDQNGDNGDNGNGDTRSGGKALGLAALAGSAIAVSRKNQDSETELQQQIAALTDQVAALTADKESLESAALEQQEQQDTLAAQLTALQEEHDALASAKAELETTAQQQEAMLTDYNDRFLTLQGQVNTLASDKSSLETSLQLKDEALIQLQTELENTQAELGSAQAELAEVHEATSGVLEESRVGGLAAVGAAAAAAAALDQRNTELDETRSQVLSLSDQLVAAEAQVFTRNSEVNDMRKQVEALNALVEQSQAEREALEAKVSSLDEELTRTSTELEAVKPYRESLSIADQLAGMPTSKRNAATAAIVAGVQPRFSPKVELLSDVRGIGPAFQQRLYKSGVGTYWEVASMSNDELRESMQVQKLQEERLDYDSLRASAYELAQGADTVGVLWEGSKVDDFEVLPGVGSAFERQLYAAGIYTWEQLVEQGADGLSQIIQAPDFRTPDFAAMVAAASQLLEQRDTAPAVEEKGDAAPAAEDPPAEVADPGDEQE